MIKIVTLVMTILMSRATGCFGIIVPLPEQLYVLEGSKGSIRCQNRSSDGQLFHSYTTNAVWYRHHDNGTNVTIGSTGSVYAMKHTLNFDPLLPGDQGRYFCCTLNGVCSSEITTVMISKPPNIKANVSSYTATVGSDITLKCNILRHGLPMADFEWKRNGIPLRGNLILIDNASISVKLSNLTMKDAGKYICSASNVRSYRSDLVELTIHKENATSFSTQITAGKFSLKFNGPQYLVFKHNLSEILQTFMLKEYNKNVTVVVTDINLIGDSLSIVFGLYLAGPSANETLQVLLIDINSSIKGLDIGIGLLKACDHTCDSSQGNHDQQNVSFSVLFLSVLIVLVVVFTVTFTIFSFLAYYSGHQKLKKQCSILSYNTSLSIPSRSKLQPANLESNSCGDTVKQKH